MLWLASVTVLTLAVWHATPRVPFHYDDSKALQQNMNIRNLGKCRDYLRNFFGGGLLYTGFSINYAMGDKLPDRSPHPRSFHVVNLLLHILNTMVCFWLVYLVLGLTGGPPPPGRRALAAAVALLFSVLPIHTMTVNMITSRSVLQAGFFSLLGITLGVLAGTGYLQSRLLRTALWTGAVVSLLAAVGSKSVGVASVALLGLLLIAFRIKGKGSALTPPRLAGFVAAGIAGGALLILLLNRSGKVWQDAYHGVWGNLLTQAGVVLRYLGLMAFPKGLSIDHYAPVVRSLGDGAAWVPVLAVVVLITFGIWLTARRLLPGVCILWYFVALAPSSSIIPRTETMLEYRAYLAALGFAGVVVWLLGALSEWAGKRLKWSGTAGCRFHLALCLVVIAAMSAVTVNRNKIFLEPISLWQDAATKSPLSARPHSNLGFYLAKRGDFEGAEHHFQEALRLKPEFAQARNNFGYALAIKGDYERAESNIAGALRIMPNYAEAHNNLGLVLMVKGEYALAESHCRTALRIRPGYAKAHNNLALALEWQGRLAEAADQYKEAVHINPAFTKARNSLGRVLVRQGKHEEAMVHLSRALREDPANASTHHNIGVALARTGRIEEAIDHYRKALGIRPGYFRAHYNLGNALAAKKDLKGAAAHYRAALEINPDFQMAREKLDQVSAKLESLNSKH